MDLMVFQYEEDLKSFENETFKGKDPELRAWALNKLSELKRHVAAAETTKG